MSHDRIRQILTRMRSEYTRAPVSAGQGSAVEGRRRTPRRDRGDAGPGHRTVDGRRFGTVTMKNGEVRRFWSAEWMLPYCVEARQG
jgi:hypothetical protein